jgi:hypothetical protein
MTQQIANPVPEMALDGLVGVLILRGRWRRATLLA